MVGDQVLAGIGELLNNCPDHNALVVRFGGKKFAVLMRDCSPREACARAEVVRRKVERLQPAGVTVTLSIGLAANRYDPEMTLNGLVGAADQALSVAKAQGRARISVHAQGALQHALASSSTAAAS